MAEKAYIAMGSNVGDRATHLAEAIRLLDLAPGVRVTRIATPLETDPVDCPPGAAPFLNSAAELRTELDPGALLRTLLEIERALGRVRSVRNAPRPIDLDLLLFGNLILETDSLSLPHPRMHQRLFVLEPLTEIAPDAMHPVLRKTIRALRDELTC